MPNTIGLEGLDQFGTLDSLPYSLDNNWTDEGICGPFTLEGLDQFSGNIDALPFSLDSTVWNTACIKLEQNVSFTGTGNLTVLLPDFIFAEAAITGTGSLTASADFVSPELASASFAGTGTLTATAIIVEPISAQAAFSGVGSLDGYISVTYANSAAFSGTGSLEIDFSSVIDVSAFIRGSTNVSAKLYIYGEEWSVVADEANTWTIVSPETNTWTEVQPGNNVWRLRA